MTRQQGQGVCRRIREAGQWATRRPSWPELAGDGAKRNPLIAIFVIIDLFLPRRFFGDRLVAGGEESFLSCEDAVEY